MTTPSQNNYVSPQLQAQLELSNVAADVQTFINNTYNALTSDVDDTKKGAAFKLQLRGIKNNINNRLNEMALTGYSAMEMLSFAKEMALHLNSVKHNFNQKIAVTDEKIMKFHSSIGNVQDKIRNQSFEPENFAPEHPSESSYQGTSTLLGAVGGSLIGQSYEKSFLKVKELEAAQAFYETIKESNKLKPYNEVLKATNREKIVELASVRAAKQAESKGMVEASKEAVEIAYKKLGSASANAMATKGVKGAIIGGVLGAGVGAGIGIVVDFALSADEAH